MNLIKLIIKSSKLANFDLICLYRRSIFGPFWVTVHSAIFIILISILWSKLLNYDPEFFFPYICSGYLLWWFISDCITQSSSVLSNNKKIISDLNSLYTIYLRNFFKSIFIHLHHLIFLLFFFLYFDALKNVNIVHLIISYLFFLVSILNIQCFVSIISSKYHDVGNLIKSLLGIAFFVTPIVWVLDSHKVPDYIILYNPFYYLIELVRRPYLGQENFEFILYAIFFIIFSFFINLMILRFSIKKLYYWLN